jgi:hypothetical protein
MNSKQSKPGRLRVANAAEEDAHLAAFSGLDSPGKHPSRKEGSK